VTNLAENLVVAATIQPHHVALRCDDLAVSFADFNDAAARVATLLARAGVQPGDRVGVVLPNTLAFAIVFYGIMHRGAVAVPMNPLLKAGEIEFHLSNTGAAALFATAVFAAEARTAAAAADVEQCWIVDDMSLGELIAELPRHAGPLARNDTDTAVILHTSRTTGRPKGAELTHGGLHRNADVTARTLIEIGPSDVVIGCLPLFHVFGLTAALNASVLAGATLTLIGRFDPHRALEVIERDRVTVFEGVPTMYSALLHAAGGVSPPATRTLRTCISGGAALPVRVITEFEKTFGCVILDGYGLSETSPVASFNHPHRVRKPGSIGTPIEG
jgi:long-chain acyl-CoA synthetase